MACLFELGDYKSCLEFITQVSTVHTQACLRDGEDPLKDRRYLFALELAILCQIKLGATTNALAKLNMLVTSSSGNGMNLLCCLRFVA